MGIEFGLTDLEDIEFDLGPFADIRDILGHDLDFLALAADDEAWAGCMEGDTDAVPSAFDDDLGEAGVLEFVAEVSTDGKVLVELIGVVLATGIPLGAPVLVDSEAECDRIYFLAHGR